MTALRVHPVERTGRIVVEAPDTSGSLRTAFVYRWTTNVLACEVWSVLRTVDLGDGISTARHSWHTTPAAACQAAVREFMPAGYGAPPFAPSMLLRRPIAPTGFLLADQVTA